jgi:hypothetical protein
MLSLILLPPIPIIQQLSVHILTSSTFTDVIFYDITDDLSFSFLFSLSLSSTELFQYYKRVLHLSLYMIILVLLYMFIFWIYLPHMAENMWLFSFWAWLTSLNMMSFNCIHLPSSHMSLFLAKAEVQMANKFNFPGYKRVVNQSNKISSHPS